jgi:transcriptional regulator with XRE-family HTH domain
VSKEIEPVYRALGARVQMIREAIGMSQAELAKLTGYSRPSIVNMECGRQRFLPHQLENIAAALSSTPKHLLKGIWL